MGHQAGCAPSPSAYGARAPLGCGPLARLVRALLVAFALLLAFSEFRYGVARPGDAPASAQQGQVIDAHLAAG
jgi:hypothetical protein